MMKKANKKDIQFEEPSDILVLFNRYLMVIIALIIIVILVPGYLFILKPKIDSIDVSETQNTATEQRREDNEKLLSRIEELEAEYYDIINNRTEDLEFLKEVLPNDLQRAEIFLTADRLAQKYDFQLFSIGISDVLDPQLAAVPISNNESDEGEVSNISSKSVNVDVDTVEGLILSAGIKTATIKFVISKEVEKYDTITGDEIYDNFKDYLAELESNMRLFDIKSLVFGGMDEIPGENGSATYSFTFNLITYYK